ncbi:hypothetical protein F511_04232 [Dorcoceras hygrometricum]|uniref:Uncharacterized protein n=1 Tax=Dorcoceras hygrometricum TaxID=472368 RepID=A0A2Z7BIF7_9LAMI|nr:hypothetical protein F511_04232 [Dorcoceras hygrometricum]
MAQYQILGRKLLGPPGTGPKQTLEVKNSVATPPRVRRTATARRRPPPAQRAAHYRTLRAPLRATIAHGGGHLRAGLLRQSALEELTNLTRTESPHRCDRNESNHVSTGGGRRRAAQGRSAAVRE